MRFLILPALLAAALAGQTIVSNVQMLGRFDASGAVSSAPALVGTTLPGTCGVGDLFFKSNASAGMNLYGCTATNTWTNVSGSGGGGSVSSVGQTVPSWLTVTGSPITTSGTLAVAATTGQTPHQVIGTCGAGTTFGPCTLVAGDLPAGTGTVTNTNGALGVSRVMIGAGGNDASVLASTGLTGQVLHSNGLSAPSFGYVNLTSDVSQSLPVGNLNNGIGASVASAWFGDATWKTVSQFLPSGAATDTLTIGAGKARFGASQICTLTAQTAKITAGASSGAYVAYLTSGCQIVVQYLSTLTGGLFTASANITLQAVGALTVPPDAIYLANGTLDGAGKSWTTVTDQTAYFATASTKSGTGINSDCSSGSCVVSVDTAVMPTLAASPNTWVGTQLFASAQLVEQNVSALGTCNAGAQGTFKAVNDAAAAPVYNATATGGGTLHIPVYCNGTNWTNH